MRMCSIASGSSGNCIYIGSERSHILIDAGISGKRVEEGLRSLQLSGQDVNGILITHEHSDHIKGLGVLSRKFGIPIYATPGTAAAIRESESLGKIDGSLFVEIKADTSFAVGDLKIEPFRISHDAAEPVAYRVACGDKTMAVATDLGVYSDYTVDKLQELDVLLLEANHDIHMLEVGGYPYYLKRRIAGEPIYLYENAGVRAGVWRAGLQDCQGWTGKPADLCEGDGRYAARKADDLCLRQPWKFRRQCIRKRR